MVSAPRVCIAAISNHFLCPHSAAQQAALARVTLVGGIVDVDDEDELIQLK